MHKYHLKKKAFNLIKDGTKTIEGRLNKSSFKNIKVNDFLNFHNDGHNIFVKIIDIKNYKTFYEMLTSENLKDITPISESINESLKIYYNCYSKENEIKYGVLALKIKLVNF